MPTCDRITTHVDLLKLIDRLAVERTLVGPVAHREPECDPPVRHFYEQVASAEALALDFDYCVYGPKPVLLPPHETLFRFDRARGRFAATPMFDRRPLALVGVHPCDLHALETLDAAFMRDIPDEHYIARRRRLLVVGIDCATPCADGVFCRDMGTWQSERGFDVMLYPLDPASQPPAARRWVLAFGSDAGRGWVLGAPALSVEPDDGVRREFEAYLAARPRAFPPRLRVSRERAAALARHAYASPVWADEGGRCCSCGSCNLVCPTCYCFDIRDDPDLEPGGGVRERCWDGCMLSGFARVAGDHDFRPEPAQRLRHRILRKLAWIEQRTGGPGCVGCGRCERACTAGIRITDIITQLAREHDDARA